MFAARRLPYSITGSYSPIVIDYLNAAPQLAQFYAQQPTKDGVLETIRKKSQQPVDRKLLVEVLRKQYEQIKPTEQTKKNIESLLDANTYTVTTAHQPNLFTGPLYFIYKIIHAIKLADSLKIELPPYHFVPVYYMGSEDADFAELNHTFVDGKKIEWNKKQTGAVGRMTVDRSLLQLISELEGQLGVETHGTEVIDLLRSAYREGRSIQEATFQLVNELYGQFGIVVLIPDHSSLKSLMISEFSQELFEKTSLPIVTATSSELSKHYHPQAHARDINLFYLKDNIRERIEEKDGRFQVLNTAISFSKAEMELELNAHPEHFSPNVILRGLFQEKILPNVIFVGGGGELAYWLQLKALFDHHKVVFPVLVLRNSFLVVQKKWGDRIEKLDLRDEFLFSSKEDILKRIVEKNTTHSMRLDTSFIQIDALYSELKSAATAVDVTLDQHVEALKAKAVRGIRNLEKKIYRAEKLRFDAERHQINSIKNALFPNGGLQERVENFSAFYARWGNDFIQELYNHSPSLDQAFTVLHELE